MKRRIGAMLACSLALFLPLTGCSFATQGPSEAVTKKTVVFWSSCVSQDRNEFYTDFTASVNKKYPDIHLVYVGVPGDISAFQQKLDLAIVSGNAPDVTNQFIAKYIWNGYYMPLDAYFDTWAGKSSMNTAQIAAIRQYDQRANQLYAIPMGTNIWIMWERKDLLAKANHKTPVTWDDFFSDIALLTDKSKNQYGLSMRGGAGSANTLEMLMYDYSGITSYFDQNGKATINNPKNLEFAERYLTAYNVYSPQDDLTKGWTQIASTFQAGNIGFTFHNLGSGSGMDSAFNGDTSIYAAVQWPVSIQGYHVQEYMPDGLSISSRSAEKAAAWKVVTEFVSKDVQISCMKCYGEIPGNTASMEDPFFSVTPYMKTGVSIVNSQAVKTLEAPYYMPEYQSVQIQMEPIVQQVMTRQLSAKTMLDQWAALLEKMRADYMVSLKSGSTQSTY